MVGAIKLECCVQSPNYFNYLSLMKVEPEIKKLGPPRVKVYVLVEASADWQDYGVGNLSFREEYNAEKQTMEQFLTVFAQKNIAQRKTLYPKRDKEWLLYSRLDIGNNYEKQENTIIRWRESEGKDELAISFTDRTRCDEYWQAIAQRRKMLCQKIGKDHLELANPKQQDLMDMPNDNNLTYIMNMATTRPTTICFHIINNPQFLNKLSRITKKLVDAKDINALTYLGRMIRTFLSFHDTRIIQSLFSNRFFDSLLNILKYSDFSGKNIDYPAVYEQRFKHRSLIHFDEVNLERINLINRIIFYMEMTLLPSTQAQLALQAYLNRTITSNYEQIFGMMVCTEKFRELGFMMYTRLEEVLEFTIELLYGLKHYTQGHEEVKWKVFSNFYDQKFVHALVEAASDKSTTEKQLIRIFEILAIIATQTEKQFMDYLKSTHTNDISLVKVWADVILGLNSNVRSCVNNFMRQLVSQAGQRKQYSQFLMSTVLYTVGDSILRGRVTDPHILQCALTSIVGVSLNILQYTDCRVGRTYQKLQLIRFMKKYFQTKQQWLYAAQLLKLALGRPLDHCRRDVKQADTELIQQMKKYNLLETLLDIFFKNTKNNNIFNSCVLECLQIITLQKSKEFLPVLHQLQDKLRQHSSMKVISKLLELIDQHQKPVSDSRYQQILENEKEEEYLQGDMEVQQSNSITRSESLVEKQLINLKSITEQISKKSEDLGDNPLFAEQIDHNRMETEKSTDIKMDFTFSFQEENGGSSGIA